MPVGSGNGVIGGAVQKIFVGDLPVEVLFVLDGFLLIGLVGDSLHLYAVVENIPIWFGDDHVGLRLLARQLSQFRLIIHRGNVVSDELLRLSHGHQVGAEQGLVNLVLDVFNGENESRSL